MRWPWRQKQTAAEADLGVPRVLAPDEIIPDPPVPDGPVRVAAPGLTVPSGPGWESIRTEGTGVEVWKRVVGDPGDRVDQWLALRAEHATTGWWPIVVDEGFWETVEFEPVDGSEAAASGAQWLVNRLFGADGPLIEELSLGAIPPVAAEVGDDRDLLLTGAAEATAILLVPAAAGWLVPEILNWEGAVNHGMSGREHTSVLRRWAGAYRAELFAMTLDTVTLRVSAPPVGRQAIVTAYEAAAYCEDAVFQGTETVGALAAMTRARLWHFWWD